MQSKPKQLDFGQILADAGLCALPEDDKAVLRARFVDELEMKVGEALADLMPDSAMEDFERLMNARDESGCIQLLDQYAPNRGEIIDKWTVVLAHSLKRAAESARARHAEPAPSREVAQ